MGGDPSGLGDAVVACVRWPWLLRSAPLRQGYVNARSWREVETGENTPTPDARGVERGNVS